MLIIRVWTLLNHGDAAYDYGDVTHNVGGTAVTLT